MTQKRRLDVVNTISASTLHTFSHTKFNNLIPKCTFDIINAIIRMCARALH